MFQEVGPHAPPQTAKMKCARAGLTFRQLRETED